MPENWKWSSRLRVLSLKGYVPKVRALAECLPRPVWVGGVLTTTGMGTLVAEGKPVVNVDGKDYLLEKPLGADIALLGASIADESGNLVYKGTTQNFNPVMAMAADLVIVEAEKVVPVGEIAPEAVHTPGIFVNYIYKRK